VIFSCTVIPNALNFSNRETMEKSLKKDGVRLFKDIHVSGHPGKEDLRDLIGMLKPERIIPCHGDVSFAVGMTNLTTELGYNISQQVHVMQDGQFLDLLR